MGRLMVPVGGEMVVRELELPVGGLRLRGGGGGSSGVCQCTGEACEVSVKAYWFCSADLCALVSSG